MGKLSACKICERPVLELTGQFEMLSPYYGEPTEDPDAFALVGEVHSKCLGHSPHGRRWSQWRLAHFTKTRGYRIVANVEGWAVMGMSRIGDRYAIHESGISIGVERQYKLGPVEDGGARARIVDTDVHLEFDDPEFVRRAQAALAKDKEVPLALLVDGLGIREQIQWPAAIDTGRWVFSRRLRRDWDDTQVSAEIHYDVWVPQVVGDVWVGTEQPAG